MKHVLLLSLCILHGVGAAVNARTAAKPEPLPQIVLSGGDAATQLQFVRLSSAVANRDWQAALMMAQELTTHPAADKDGVIYPAACYIEVASLYQLRDYEAVVKRASEVINNRDIKASGAQQGLSPRQAASFNGYVYYFLMDSYIHLSGQASAWQVFEEYIARYSDPAESDGSAATAMCYTAILLRVDRALADKKAEELAAAQECFDYWREHGITWDGKFAAAEQLVADAQHKLQSEK
jgi:hypothetical protein